MRSGVLVAVCMLLNGCAVVRQASTGAVQVLEVRLVGYGLYRETEVEKVRAAKDDEELVGEKLVEIRKEHVRTTDRIETKKGVLFGIEFEIAESGDGSEVEIEVVHLHPPIRSPSKAEYTRQNYTVKKKLGLPHHALYMLEDDYELVTGMWRIQIHCQGRKCLEKSFELVKPE